MDIKHGDVITLQNGDVVKVSLEVIQQKVTQLVPGKYYRIRHTGQYCHWYNYQGTIDGKELNGQTFQYVGNINLDGGGIRAIFYAGERSSYLMMGCDNLDYIIAQVSV